MDRYKSGIELIRDERDRQINVEGFDASHDDEHEEGQLLDAALCYIQCGGDPIQEAPGIWPWDSKWWKPSDDYSCDLVKAGALIAAEIDRRKRIYDNRSVCAKCGLPPGHDGGCGT